MNIQPVLDVHRDQFGNLGLAVASVEVEIVFHLGHRNNPPDAKVPELGTETVAEVKEKGSTLVECGFSVDGLGVFEIGRHHFEDQGVRPNGWLLRLLLACQPMMGIGILQNVFGDLRWFSALSNRGVLLPSCSVTYHPLPLRY